MNLIKAFKQAIEEVKVRWTSIDKGTPLYIPFPDELSRLKRYIPGLIKKENYLITAQTGIGKSKFTRFLFINWPIQYVKKYKNIKLHIIYNTLEETEEELIAGFIIEYISEKYGIAVDYYDVFGFREDTPKHIRDKVLEAEQKIAELEPYLEITTEANPTGLYKKAREYALIAGKFYYQGKEVSVEKMKAGAEWDKYVPDPSTYVIVIHDRLLLFNEESKHGKRMNKYETIMNWMDYYCRQELNKKFGFITINIQQQIPAGEAKQYTNKGESIDDKLLPSLDKLNEVKATQQAITVGLGIFSPVKYGITRRYEFSDGGYDIRTLRNFYREIMILKHRKGLDTKVFPVFFDGAAETFQDLPEPKEAKALNKFYKKATNRHKKEAVSEQLIMDFDFLKDSDNII